MTAIHPVAALARRFTVDWLDAADPAVPPMIMTPDYRVHIGSTDLDGLAAYADGTTGQLAQFPGLLLTVHRLVTDGSQLALVFTEHGASARHDGRVAAWRGVALFRTEHGLLAENWTQEDYYGRRRQLTSGSPDPVPAPAPAPWTTPPGPADAAAESVAALWLQAPSFDGVTVDDGAPPVVDVTGATVRRLFSAGPAVAFATSWSGPYAGGLDGVDGTGQPAVLHAAGVLDVAAGSVVSGIVVTDRHGLRSRLRAPLP